MFGYAGKMLEVNLSTQKIKTRKLEPDLARDYIGGIGFNARILYDEIPAGADPLGPDNVLVFSVGCLVGTPFPTASRMEVSAKSPASNGFGSSNSGAFLGLRLKCAGYDGMIIKGQAQKPVYLLIEEDTIEIKEASFIWGKDAWESIDLLKARHYGAEIMLIGQAGENLVRFASIENGYYDGFGRTGMGAVMGSKKLKAVVVRGSKPIVPADPQGVLELSAKGQKLIKSASSYQAFCAYGTMNATIPYGGFNALSVHNYSRGTLPDWKQKAGRQIVDIYGSRHIACQSCIIACGHLAEINEGKYAGTLVKDMEITPTVSYSSNVGLSTEASIKSSELCQRYGIDMSSSGSVIAFAMELYQKGIINKDDVGYELAFGDDDAAFALLRDISLRQGIGDILAEGVKRAAEHWPGADDYAIHVKGVEVPMIDPRGRWSTWTLGMLTNIRGGDHLRCRNPVENLRYNENLYHYQKERFGFKKPMYDRLDMPENLKSAAIDLESDTVDIAIMSKWAEDLINLYNSVGICIRPPIMETIGPTLLAEIYTCMTGIPMSPDELMMGSERAWNLMKLFNIRHGEVAGDSKFPRRFYRELQSGNIVDEDKVQAVLEQYWQARGWDPGTGHPLPETEKRLGI
ncbi:aldehyde ferredoxin oxidoreductase family protein [Syntrophomonas wolfei]|uniref:Aldehyde ferredoxin oxidoreductase n=1 Tax=Syntrophomonas wolfei subsp. wolfei (strain DSM 2245B / Goettingen) TaxID=335541 RepID=Q0AVX1_SYNWW|nr:aldehyde ferredoxin oxidoreductase family protein [Syntrophomonas wolfei]ABI69133.1 Aldehyde ferredoxin oxidoreductase [Syntrophomonas wolfei subsp. wolfei str. Goettingen G311]